MAGGSPTMRLSNPYLEFYRAMPAACQRDPSLPVSAAELLAPQWLQLKAAIAGHFAWAVPTEQAVLTILKYARKVVEIGAGSGYWAWMMRQAGIEVVAFDTHPAPFTWSEVAYGDERAALLYPDRALFLCWPPWNSDTACNALTFHRGDYLIYVGEWMGGCANPRFFALLTARYDAIDAVDLPQWYNRDDRLMIFRRKVPQTSP